MPFRKKVLYYGLMLLLTLLTLEGMARLAYYTAYGSGYGGGRADIPSDVTPPPINDLTGNFDLQRIRHPFYGFTDSAPGHALNAMPPRQRREDAVIIGLLGGSVAAGVKPLLQNALNRWFANNNSPRQPTIIDLTGEGIKQPQQMLIVAHTLQLGGEFDLIVNLDGFNEITASVSQGLYEGVFPFFPLWWDKRVGLTSAEILLSGSIGVLRQEQARLAQDAATSPWRWTAVFGLAHRWRQERTAGEIIRLNHELAATQAGYILEKHGPRSRLKKDTELFAEAARVWYRNSVILAWLADLAGADYYHFLQPNQYVPDTKPLSPEEREFAYSPDSPKKPLVEQGYPQLRAFNPELQKRGVNYFDLTGIFRDHPETLYRDDCCHFNDRGYELLAAAMVQRMAPALQRRGSPSPAAPVSELDAARRPPELDAAGNPIEPAAAPVNPDFRVYLAEGRTAVQYVRANCAPADVEHPFFLHLTPREVSDLPPAHRESGFENRDFNFYAAGGEFQEGQCMVQVPLPAYPLARLRTGQYVAGVGELWIANFPFPEE